MMTKPGNLIRDFSFSGGRHLSWTNNLIKDFFSDAVYPSQAIALGTSPSAMDVVYLNQADTLRTSPPVDAVHNNLTSLEPLGFPFKIHPFPFDIFLNSAPCHDLTGMERHLGPFFV